MQDNKPINLEVFRDYVTNYVVTPINAFGIGGFVFDSEGESKAELKAEVSEHFIEDGSTIADHIALKPKTITLKNYVGELVYRQDDTTDTFVQKVARKLTTINSFLPQVTDMAQQALKLKNTTELKKTIGDFVPNSKTVNRVADYWALAKNMMSGGSRQQQAYMYFKAIMEQKLLVSVQTPFEFMSNMVIESISAIQTDDDKWSSDFTITLKQIRTTNDIFTPRGRVTTVISGETGKITDVVQGRAAPQLSTPVNNGSTQGLPTDLDEMFGDTYNTFSPAMPPPLPLPPPVE